MGTTFRTVAGLLAAGYALCAVAQAVPVRTLELPPKQGNPRNSEGAFVTLKDGTILFVYTHFTGGRGDHATAHLAGRHSSDGGKTWTQEDRLIVANEGGMNVMSVSLLRLQSGGIALFYLLKNSEQDCRPVMRISTDEGQSWSAASPCIQDQVGYYVLNNDRAIQLANGRLVLPVCLHWPQGAPKADWQGELMCYLSDDNGKSWRRSQSAFKGYDTNGQRVTTQEPGVVELKDGRVMMFIRASGGCQYLAWSSDGADTWSAPVASTLKSPLSPASIKRLPTTGDLLAVWNNHAHIPANLAKQRVPLSTAISKDDGQTWQHVKVLEGNPHGWYCYIAIHPHNDTVLLGYCAMGGLAHSRITYIPISWLYHDAPTRLTISQTIPEFNIITAAPFERLETTSGIWTAAPDHAATIIYARGKGIHLAGGQNRTVTLTLPQSQPCATILTRLGVERFTAQAPYQLTIEAQSANGWRTLWEQGADTTVGYPIPITLPESSGSASHLRFRCTSAKGAIITDAQGTALHGFFND